MGKRQQYLEKLIYSKYESSSEHRLLALNDVLGSGYSDIIFEMYKGLGGIGETLKFRLGSYDIPCKDFIIELDEELHFNRYRELTLQSDVYKELSNFPLDSYLSYCENHEVQCLKAGSFGGKWKNNSTENYFGTSSVYGELSGTGASRWKQRAFYDFLKDISQLIIAVKVIRISIWDSIELNGNLYKIGYLLDNHKENELWQFIKQRLDC